MTVLISFCIFILAVVGTPLFAVIGASAMINFARDGGDLQSVILAFYDLSTKPMLHALFLFAFAGCMLGHSKAPQRLLRFSNALLGWLPGGLAIVAVVSCALLTSFTGASGITIVALGGLLLPALLAKNYDRKFSLGVVTSSGSLGLLFPPSLPVILYGVIAGTSIDELFIAGIIPGALMVLVLSGYAFYKGLHKDIARTKFTFNEVWHALLEAKYELPLPILIIGGIYSGFIAISEAAVIVAAYIIIVEMFIHREIKFSKLGKVARESVILTGGILIILGMALAATSYMIDAEIPDKVFEFARHYMNSKITFLLTLNVFLLVVGCMIDIYAATVLILPLIIPIAAAFGVHPVHLGIIFLVNMGIGYITPPVGLNLFIANIRFREPIYKLYKAAIPFVILLLLVLLAVTYIPQLSLVLLGAETVNETENITLGLDTDEPLDTVDESDAIISGSVNDYE
jgi:tripartite ATP-independent transporter DctM subunit